MGANPAKLMYAGESTEGDPVIEHDMATELRAVSKCHVIADHTIVGHMNVGHDPVVVPDSGAPLILNRSGVHRHKFTERVAITDLQYRWLTSIFFILRR